MPARQHILRAALIGSHAQQGGMMEPAYFCLVTLALCAAAIVGFAWRRIQADEVARSTDSEQARPERPQRLTDRTVIRDV